MDDFEKNMDMDMSQMSALAAAFGLGQDRGIQSVADQCSGFMKRIATACPVQTAATYAALLLQPAFQKNCYRIEMLVHFSLAAGGGSTAPSPQILTQGYSEVGNAYGMLEDPPEDIFVANISSKRGNYLVLNGIWEGAGFYLQKIVDLADTLPQQGEPRRIADAIHALLKISDFVCNRAGLKRFEMGVEEGQERLSFKVEGKPSSLRALTAISQAELTQLGVDFYDLELFIFNPAERYELLNQTFGNSILERRPLAMLNDELYLVLPTAVSLTIRSLFIHCFGMGPGQDAFFQNLGFEYSKTLSNTPLTNGLPQSLKFVKQDFGWFACASQKADAGRYLNVICFLDTLEAFEEESFAEVFQGDEAWQSKLDDVAAELEGISSAQSDFESGITLIIGCGVGRGTVFALGGTKRLGWTCHFVSAHDFCTLSSVEGFQLLDLWRLVDAQAKLAEMKVWLQNINGLLNLYAWADALDGHMVPHHHIPDYDGSAGPIMMAVQQNGLLTLRHRVALASDAHVQQYIDGSWKLIRKEGRSHFEEDDSHPLYAYVPDGPNEELLGAFITPVRCWWSQLASPEGTVTLSYDRWKMLGVWLVRAARILEHHFGGELGSAPLLWRCIFESVQGKVEIEALGCASDAEQAITINVNPNLRTVELIIGPDFDRALYHPENVAERALVKAFVRGVVELVEGDNVLIDVLVDEIVVNSQARHSHTLKPQKFRDYVSQSPQMSSWDLISINRFDDALGKLGFGWSVRSRADGNTVSGKNNCQTYLNALVSQIELDLCQELRQFDRTSVLTLLIRNHESASISRDQWHYTAAAVLALRDDRAATLVAMRDHEFKLNAIFQPTRNLIEMAICECPIDAPRTLGKLDAARLLAKASRLYHIGGWSDLIRWDLMDPVVIIQPLGDVHVSHEFMDTVLQDYGSATSTYRYLDSARNYGRSLSEPAVHTAGSESLAPEFSLAWESELGASLEHYGNLIGAFEDEAFARKVTYFTARRSALLAMASTSVLGETIIQNLTLAPRRTWSELPEGYDKKDIAPWRFRRRLSLLRRPLMQLTDEPDPIVLVVPGLIREGFASTVRNYYTGSYPDRHLGTAMRRYAGTARNRDGMAFNIKVADRLRELGWQIEYEVRPTKILGKSLDRDYGDVDVLAWSFNSRRVLIIECKDLQFKKTYGEIAEQLSDFRGLQIDGKRDLLRKHLDRVKVLNEHQPQTLSYLKMPSDARLDSVVVFRHPVPMLYAEGPIRQETITCTFDDLDKL